MKTLSALSAGWRVDGPRVRFAALAAAVIAACNVGGIQLSSHFGTERNVFGKLLLGLCMIIVPLFHPKWRSIDRCDARNTIVDICAAWLLGFGAETAYLITLRPAGLRLFDVVGLAGVSIALAAFSLGVAGAVDAVVADVWRIATGQATLPAGVGGPYTALSSDEEPRTPMRGERWMYGGMLVILSAAIAFWQMHRRQYLWGIGSAALCVMFGFTIATAPAGPARRLSIYGCFCIAVLPIVKLLVFG